MGQVFAGRYELVEPIAEGAMGSVWLVRDRRDDTVKAAKVLRQQDAGSLLRFIREQGTRIHHPHVVTPLGWAGEDDQVLFTMPLLRGGSVATLLGDYGALPEAWVVELLGQCLTGLAAVHAAGVVHRDIKPANLLLEHTGRGVPHLRISDFGIAVPTDQPRLTAPMMTLGTPGYMAPEQERGADPDPRQDLYAVGVTGLQLLSGRRPPRDGVPVAYDALPASPLVGLLRRAADPDPARRPQHAEEFAGLLRGVAAAGPWDPGDVEVLAHWDVPPGGTRPAARQRAGSVTPAADTPAADAHAADTPVADGPVVGTDRAGAPAARWPVLLLLVLGLVLLVGGLALLTW